MPRILLITRNLPPLVGGMERLNWHLVDELLKWAEVRVVAPLGTTAMAPVGSSVTEVPLRPLWRFLLTSYCRARRNARQWKPDIVLAGSGLTAPLALLVARAYGAKAVAYVHGLDVAVNHRLYRVLWLPALRRMDRLIANSHATAGLCGAIGVDLTRIGMVHPGVDMSGVKSSERVLETQFRQRHNLGGRPLLLSVGRLNARKGLWEFVAQSLPQIVAVRPDVMLVVVGDTPKQALHANGQTVESIRATATQAGVAGNLYFLGTVSDEELGVVYRASSVHVFPVREIPGDPEGFGMVAVEAAAHGLPTVAFAVGGVTDAVADKESGYLVLPGDYAAFGEAVLRILANGGDGLRVNSMRFAQRFVWSAFGAQVAGELACVLPGIVKMDATA